MIFLALFPQSFCKAVGAGLRADAVPAVDYAGIAVQGVGILLMAGGLFCQDEARRRLPFAPGAAAGTPPRR